MLRDGDERKELQLLRNNDFLPGVWGEEADETALLLSRIGDEGAGDEVLILTVEGSRGGVVPSQGRKYARYSSASVVYKESPV